MRTLSFALVITALATGPGSGGVLAQGSADSAAAALRADCDYGITRAFSGHRGEARAAFLSILGQAPGDARALNNLGNLSLMDGDPALARAFYDRACASDSLDAGIRLNLATAWMLEGNRERADAEAAAGVELAGGLREARRLLGLRDEPEDRMPPAKAAPGAHVTRAEVRALLETALKKVPADSLHRAAAPPAPARGGSRAQPRSRPAGPRASGDMDALDVLYWKR
jgi:hypothetical protein